MEIEYAAINFLKEKDDLKDNGISKDINCVKYIYCNASRNIKKSLPMIVHPQEFLGFWFQCILAQILVTCKLI